MIKTVEQVEAELDALIEAQGYWYNKSADLHAHANAAQACGGAMNDTIRNKRNELLVARGETA